MPNRHTTDNNYRYAFQGQEKDGETGMEAFELRLWDGRIGRWLTIDPYYEFHSPYLGMGNNPISKIDPNGGCTDCSACPELCNGAGMNSIPSGFMLNEYEAGKFNLSEIIILDEVAVSNQLYKEDNKGFFIPTDDRIFGTVLPDDITNKYRILEYIDGELYHKHTGGLLGKKAYNPAEESFFSELQENAVPGAKRLPLLTKTKNKGNYIISK